MQTEKKYGAATSNGVVIAAAIPPATAPHTATAAGVNSSPVLVVQFAFKCSQIGNWINAKGTSRKMYSDFGAPEGTQPATTTCFPTFKPF
ncbi:hypothetical protein Bhyg_15599 [Pseudolycoriella hygida]|uniref:Uncharacterized protein n=1 Tax=Pseudolycoriella hygida TaxID=35572 RepID=A0A9Q0RV93_9DIPT|nr:hypothetical protein Bhyg_15599 [Pseudolycoriella hygida]